MRNLALIGWLLLAPVTGSVIASQPAPSHWTTQQYQEALKTVDPIARRLLLEHLLAALTPDDPLWFRVRGQLMVLSRL